MVRDSAQVAERVPQPECGPDFTRNLGLDETEDYCGGMSIWDVATNGAFVQPVWLTPSRIR